MSCIVLDALYSSLLAFISLAALQNGGIKSLVLVHIIYSVLYCVFVKILFFIPSMFFAMSGLYFLDAVTSHLSTCLD